jgi:leucyl aminopeptidase
LNQSIKASEREAVTLGEANSNITTKRAERSVPLILLSEADLSDWLERRTAEERQWLQSSAFEAKPGTHCLIPNADGTIAAVALGVDAELDVWSLSRAADVLPPGGYHLENDLPVSELEHIALGWALASYRFDRYCSNEEAVPDRAVLALGNTDVHQAVQETFDAVTLVRDLINTPADDLPPAMLAAACESLANEFDGVCKVITGHDLERDYPAVHAVGRAAAHTPCLIDLRWGESEHPRVAIVGKGVCFDSGGLDVKSSTGMRLMKKDMGGAAHAIGVARLIMSRRLRVQLQLVVPAVENAIAGNAYRPGDVVKTRRGLGIEIDNTDAEGRVILSDALALASEGAPELIIDFATLTGAARVALGTELPAMFCNDDALANGILQRGVAGNDPVWRRPLHAPYNELIKSKVADVLNAGTTPFGGAITAALFLDHFVGDGIPWAHFDVMAWNVAAKPGRPEGGEAMGLRAVFGYLSDRFGS